MQTGSMLQELLMVMTDRIVVLPPLSHARLEAKYNDVGIVVPPVMERHHRDAFLGMMLGGEKTPAVTQHFVRHALPLVPEWFLEQISHSLQHGRQTGPVSIYAKIISELPFLCPKSCGTVVCYALFFGASGYTAGRLPPADFSLVRLSTFEHFQTYRRQ